MEASFNDTEKRFVLAEMIKASQMDVHTLVEFVKSYNIQPDWLQMQLPGGRNLGQCLRATEGMFNVQFPPPPVPPLKRKSVDDTNEHFPKRQAVASPIEPPVYQASRSFHSQPLNIQPRPPPKAPNGYPVTTSSPAVSTTSTPTTVPGRRRGRPSKADKEAQARANASLPTTYAPISPAPVQLAPHPSHLTTPQGYASSPTGPPSYSISSQSHDLKPRRRARPPADRAASSSSVPRTASPHMASQADERDKQGSHERQDMSSRPENTVRREPTTNQELPSAKTVLEPKQAPEAGRTQAGLGDGITPLGLHQAAQGARPLDSSA